MTQELIVTIEKLLWRGRGLGRLDSGQVILVEPGILPGEEVQVQVLQRKKDYLLTQAQEILSPSNLRQAHPCVHAPACGGSAFGILALQAGLELKKAILTDALTRALGQVQATQLLSALKVVPSGQAWRYRWRGQIHVHNKKPHTKAPGSSTLIPIEDCLLLAKPLGQALTTLAQDLKDGRHTLAASPLTGQVAHEHDPRPLPFSWPQFDLTIHLPAQVFFQAHWDLNQSLVHEVVDFVRDHQRIADLFSGLGNFALPLATMGKDILAMESVQAALAVGQTCAQEHGLDQKVGFVRANLFQPGSWAQIKDFAPTALILDPPRTGAKGIAKQLVNLPSVQRVVWVACDLVNTLRDARLLLDQGWQISSIVLVDMFPSTWHMEVVLVLDRP